jgi:hypothetical protein
MKQFYELYWNVPYIILEFFINFNVLKRGFKVPDNSYWEQVNLDKEKISLKGCSPCPITGVGGPQLGKLAGKRQRRVPNG